LNSGELGLVNSAFNSLLGTVGAQSAQQTTPDKTFNRIFDNKMSYANKQAERTPLSSKKEQVNRENVTVKDSEPEKEREAYVKSDMQKPKKAIAKATKEKVESVSKDQKLKKTEDAENIEAIESAASTEVVEEVQVVEENKVLQELMALLNSETLSDQEKIDGMNELLGKLSSGELGELKNSLGELKDLLMSVNGSLNNFEQTLSQLPVEGETFENILEGMEMIEEEVAILDGSVVNGEVTKASDELPEEISLEQLNSVEEVVAEKVSSEKVAEESPKETKAEQLKAAAEQSENTTVVSEVNTDSSSRQTNQQQSNADSNQSFAESLKFHNATVKTAAMKGTMASNPFEEKIMQQIIKGTQVSMNVGKDVSEMMIKLNPKDLGNVSLKISLKNEQLVAEFNVENKTVKEVLESRLDDLKTALSDKGFTIEGLDVSVNQDADEQFRSYEEFIKQQKGKKRFNDVEGIETVQGIDSVEETAAKWQTLETTSSEINTLA